MSQEGKEESGGDGSDERARRKSLVGGGCGEAGEEEGKEAMAGAQARSPEQ